MSRPVPKKDYEKKALTKLIPWAKGEADPYLGNIEAEAPKEVRIDERLVQRHKREREIVVRHVFDQEHNPIYRGFKRVYRAVSELCCVALISILLLAVSYLPPVGDPSNPANNEVVDKYIADGIEDTGAVNFVTGMILDYRAFDTFGESNVLFIATCVVLAALKDDVKKNDKRAAVLAERERHYEPKDDSILQKITFALFPVIMVFGVYILLNGHLSPGGGFAGGAIIGAGLILYANAFGFEKLSRFFTEKTYKRVSFCALTFYCLAKSYSFFTGANHLHSIISTGTPGNIISAGLILPLNICVGLVVACTMYAFYTLFKKGGF